MAKFFANIDELDNLRFREDGFLVTLRPNSGITYTADIAIDLPNTASADTIVSRTSTDTMTNKTLTSPKINEAVALTATSTDLNQITGISVGGTLSSSIVTIGATQTLLAKTLDAGSNTITNLTNSSIAAGAGIVYSKLNLSSSIVNADVAAGAAIVYSKLSLSNSIVNADVNTAAAIAYSKLNLATSIVNADVNASAAIAYSKLNLSGSVVNADVSASAGIVYSKLDLSASIVNADIATAAAIARSKVAAGTANHVIINDGSGNLSSEAALAITRGGSGQITANAALNAFLPSQTGNNGKVLGTDGADSSWVTTLTNPMTTAGDLIVGGSGGATTRLAAGASNTVLTGGATPSFALLVDANISASAAIVDTKLAQITTANKVSGTAITTGNISTSGSLNTTNDSGYKITGSKTAQLSVDATNAYLDSSGPLVLRSNGTTTALTFSNTQIPTFTGGNFRLAADTAGLGNAASPYMTPSDDTNTGLFFLGADQLGIATGGVSALQFSSGQVGTFSQPMAVSTFSTAGVVHNNSSGVFSSSTIVNADVSASAAIAYSKLNLATSIVNADISTSAAIAYSKLNLATSIVNADISASAAIVYSKLSLSNSIVNADINSSAAIDGSKIVAATGSVAGVVSTGTQTFAGTKTFSGGNFRLSTTGAGNAATPYMTASDDTDTGMYMSANLYGISAAGNVGFEVQSAGVTFNKATTAPAGAIDIYGDSTTPGANEILTGRQSDGTVHFYNGNTNGSATGESSTAAIFKFRQDSNSGRSINAAGTINASGADYAEYMYKDITEDVIAKGEVCGVKANGKLTKKWSEAISFVVKSTNPSYVGGDAWSLRSVPEEGETWEQLMVLVELERVKVDRVAFSGQVPCIVTGSFIPGDWIVPVALDDTIQAQAVSDADITFSQYKQAVGRVWKVMDDGKALISIGLK